MKTSWHSKFVSRTIKHENVISFHFIFSFILTHLDDLVSVFIKSVHEQRQHRKRQHWEQRTFDQKKNSKDYPRIVITRGAQQNSKLSNHRAQLKNFETFFLMLLIFGIWSSKLFNVKSLRKSKCFQVQSVICSILKTVDWAWAVKLITMNPPSSARRRSLNIRQIVLIRKQNHETSCKEFSGNRLRFQFQVFIASSDSPETIE